MSEAHLHSMSIFDCPSVIAVSDDGCLSLHIGTVTIHLYGQDPYKEAPKIVEMTPEQQREAAKGELLRRIGYEAPQVSIDVPTGDAPDSVGTPG